MIYQFNYALILAIKPQFWIKSQSGSYNWWESESVLLLLRMMTMMSIASICPRCVRAAPPAPSR